MPLHFFLLSPLPLAHLEPIFAIKRSIASHLFDNLLHHVAIIVAGITGIEFLVVHAAHGDQLQFQFATGELQLPWFGFQLDLGVGAGGA